MEVHSKACCTRPPVTLAGGYDYELRGEYVHYNGLLTCKMNPTTATHLTSPYPRTSTSTLPINQNIVICDLTYMQSR